MTPSSTELRWRLRRALLEAATEVERKRRRLAELDAERDALRQTLAEQEADLEILELRVRAFLTARGQELDLEITMGAKSNAS